MPELAQPGKFSQMFNDALRDTGITMKDLAARSEFQYESFRKLSKGMTNPGPEMLRLLHKELGLDIKKMELAVTEDKARRKGMWKIVSAAAGKIIEMEPIERVWPDLNENDKRELIQMAQMKAKFNRSLGTARKHA